MDPDPSKLLGNCAHLSVRTDVLRVRMGQMPLQPLVMLVLLAAVLTRTLQHLVAEHHGGGLRLAFRHNRRRFGRRRQRRFNILRRGGGRRGRLVTVRTRPFPLFSVAAALRAVAGLFLSLSAIFGRAGGGGEGEFVRAAATFCGAAAAAALTAFAALLFAAAQVLARLRLGGCVGAPPALPASLPARLRGVRKPEKKEKGLMIICKQKRQCFRSRSPLNWRPQIRIWLK
jgi:hypothetical protein